MGKKIMILTGSPRKNGNTAVVSEWVAEGAKEAGATVETVDAASLNYKVSGCVACFGCQKIKEYRCVVDDGASAVLARIPEADVIVLATPVYFWGFSAQIKHLLDRFFSLCKISGDEVSHPLKGKKWALIATAGGGEGDGLNLCGKTIDAIAAFYGSQAEKLLAPRCPLEPGKTRSDAGLREKALAFGAKLAK